MRNFRVGYLLYWTLRFDDYNIQFMTSLHDFFDGKKYFQYILVKIRVDKLGQITICNKKQIIIV
jgi:hypothetical protein